MGEPQEMEEVVVEPPLLRKRAVSNASVKNAELSKRPEANIEWKNIVLSRTVEMGPFWRPQSFKNDILKGVSGGVRAGEMLAIMGPTGCGKTSLLNVLSFRTQPDSGLITINGAPLSKKHKRLTAYVLQQDTFLSALTVKETLRDTARLRLPAELTYDEKMDVVDDIINSVDLNKAADTAVGSFFPFKRGISGGEKKRLNIANELLTNPGILFVDEPTSGLDSATSFVVLSLLKDLANRGCTIVTTIHQPSSQIFALFDNLMLMADGNVVYMGKAAEAIDYMAQITSPCPSNYNPSDYLLELLVDRVDENGDPLKLKLIEEYKKRNPSSDEPAVAEENDDDTDFGEKYPSSWFEQFNVLFYRNLKMKVDRVFSYLVFFQYMAMILTCMVVWWDRSKEYSSFADRTGLLFFAIVYFNVSPLMVTIMQFAMDRQVHEKERATGTYRLSAFFMARVTSDTPLDCLFPVLFSCIVYWTTNMNHDVWRFFLFILLLSVVVFNGICFGLMFGCMYLDIQTGTVYALSYFLLCMLLGGFFVQDLQNWIRWCRYLSPVYYGFNIGMIIEFEDDDYCFTKDEDDQSNGGFICGPTIIRTDVDVLADDWWANIIGIFGLSFLALTVGYLALRFMNRPH